MKDERTYQALMALTELEAAALAMLEALERAREALRERGGSTGDSTTIYRETSGPRWRQSPKEVTRKPGKRPFRSIVYCAKPNACISGGAPRRTGTSEPCWPSMCRWTTPLP